VYEPLFAPAFIQAMLHCVKASAHPPADPLELESESEAGAESVLAAAGGVLSVDNAESELVDGLDALLTMLSAIEAVDDELETADAAAPPTDPEGKFDITKPLSKLDPAHPVVASLRKLEGIVLVAEVSQVKSIMSRYCS